MAKFHILRPLNEKLCELMLYIADQSLSDRAFGAVKLNKLLWYIDVEAYRKLGRTITGAEYRHLQEGPAPPANKARDYLVSVGRAEVQRIPTGKKDQERLVPKQPPKEELFTSEELRLARGIIEKYWNENGTSLSNKTHKEYPYRLTKEKQVIPWELTLISTEPPTKKQIEMGRTIAQKRGLAV